MSNIELLLNAKRENLMKINRCKTSKSKKKKKKKKENP